MEKRRQNEHSQTGFLGSSALFILLVCVAASLILAGTLLAFFHSDIPAKVSDRTLSFADRVAYQREIENVYWRHRIWPKERPDPKPALEAVMPQLQLEKKVTDYLYNSQSLEDYWQRPITAEQLQAEMDRMAQQTRQPDVLREVFEALDNDPFVIAECLARATVTERLITDLSTQEKRSHAQSAQMKEFRSMSLPRTMGNVAYALPKISEGDPPCIDDTWAATTTTNAPSARYNHTAVWTGTEMIIWGGYNAPSVFNSGGRYNPVTNSWTATSTTNAPSARGDHTAVWTGSEMIVWGGGTILTGSNTGGRYNPSTDSWIATNITNAPAGRFEHTVVWTGSEMIVWGGRNDNNVYFNIGGRYNPSTDSWTSTGITNAPSARSTHAAIWTGSEMIIWGGYDGFNFLNTGGRYDPDTNSWIVTSTTNAPTARRFHTVVWTGSEMILWGGEGNSGFLNAGGRYNPSTDTWTVTSSTNAPSARDFHTSIWTGSEMIIWGGYSGNSDLDGDGRYSAESAAPTPTPSEPPPTATPTATPTSTPGPGTGARYDPDTDTWIATSTTDAPSARYAHTAVWTGSQMIVWGGSDVLGNTLQTGGRYCAQSASPTPTPTPTATPTPIASPTARPTPAPRSRPSPAPRP
jgi:N-acetylneuraminic acid mutarotase